MTHPDLPRIIEFSLISLTESPVPATLEKTSRRVLPEARSKNQSDNRFESNNSSSKSSTDVDTLNDTTGLHYASTTDTLNVSDKNSIINTDKITAAPELTIEEIKNLYEKENLRLIANSIRKHTVYPPFAEEAGISGVVKIQFVILTDGSIGTITVYNSSGSRILDQDALETVKRSGPFPKPSLPVILNFPMEYNLY